jgi:hypothetical protein
MLGHTYPSYRQRRSFKKYYYALFAVFTIVLYRSGTFSKARNVNDERLAQQIVPRGYETPEDTPPGSPPVIDAFGHHIHPQPKDVENIDARYAPGSPQASPVAGTFQQKDTAKLLDNFHAQHMNDDHDIDDIDTIRDHSADKMEDTGKLTHPDDGVETEGEQPDFDTSGQVRLDQSERVDELLKADHPSKEVHSETNDLDIDLDELVETSNDVMQFPIQTLKEMTPFSEAYVFPSWDECQTVKEKADDLPDMVHVPFEQSVADVVLEGWEDEWIAKARYTGPKLEEPRIDFVYNCESLPLYYLTSTD